jgi:hypothetical protein
MPMTTWPCGWVDICMALKRALGQPRLRNLRSGGKPRLGYDDDLERSNSYIAMMQLRRWHKELGNSILTGAVDKSTLIKRGGASASTAFIVSPDWGVCAHCLKVLLIALRSNQSLFTVFCNCLCKHQHGDLRLTDRG